MYARRLNTKCPVEYMHMIQYFTPSTNTQVILSLSGFDKESKTVCVHGGMWILLANWKKVRRKTSQTIHACMFFGLYVASWESKEWENKSCPTGSQNVRGNYRKSKVYIVNPIMWLTPNILLILHRTKSKVQTYLGAQISWLPWPIIRLLMSTTFCFGNKWIRILFSRIFCI